MLSMRVFKGLLYNWGPKALTALCPYWSKLIPTKGPLCCTVAVMQRNKVTKYHLRPSHLEWDFTRRIYSNKQCGKVTHFLSSSRAISFFTSWYSSAILQCCLYTCIDSWESWQGGRGFMNRRRKKNTAFECNIRNEHIFWKIKLSVHLCENREKSWMLWEKLLYWKYSFPQKGKNAFLHMNMHKPSNFVRIFSAFHNNFAKYHERLFKERFLPYLFLFHL